MLRFKAGDPSQVRLYEDGTFRRLSDVVRQEKAVAGIDGGFYSGRGDMHPKGSVPCGQLVINDQNVRTPVDQHPNGTRDAHYHAVYKKGGKVIIDQWIPYPEPGNPVEWGIKMGPRLLKDGLVCKESINDPRWDINRSACARVAIGVRADDSVILAYDPKATLERMAEEMKAEGCIEALGCDGGSSGCYSDVEKGDNIGFKLMPNFFLMMPSRTEAEKPQEPEPPEGGERPKMIVCIDPGHGGPDPGAVGPDMTLEKHITLYVAKRVKEYLARGGVKAVLTRETDTDVAPGLDDKEEMIARDNVANAAGADYLVSIHVDSYKDPEVSGFKLFHWPGSVKGLALSESIARHYEVATGLQLRSISPETYLIFNFTDCATILIELGFMTNTADRALLKEPAFLDKCALGIAFGILAMSAN